MFTPAGYITTRWPLTQNIWQAAENNNISLIEPHWLVKIWFPWRCLWAPWQQPPRAVMERDMGNYRDIREKIETIRDETISPALTGQYNNHDTTDARIEKPSNHLAWTDINTLINLIISIVEIKYDHLNHNSFLICSFRSCMLLFWSTKRENKWPQKH